MIFSKQPHFKENMYLMRLKKVKRIKIKYPTIIDQTKDCSLILEIYSSSFLFFEKAIKLNPITIIIGNKVVPNDVSVILKNLYSWLPKREPISNS